ncbi:hypothetical protein DFJ74DRAFT_702076 [Hyaloraphidium curvatum]|nr:hypothetical protein DFJ74DRAFT_702076 [Hyaloraphidium curvatum]
MGQTMCRICGDTTEVDKTGPRGYNSFQEGQALGPDMPLEQQRKAAQEGLRISQEIAREQGGLATAPAPAAPAFVGQEAAKA